MLYTCAPLRTEDSGYLQATTDGVISSFSTRFTFPSNEILKLKIEALFRLLIVYMTQKKKIKH